jgi:hypothetical protein
MTTPRRPHARTMLRLVTTAQTRLLTPAEGLNLGRSITWTSHELTRAQAAEDAAEDRHRTATDALDLAEARLNTARKALREVLSELRFETHPGQRCLQTGHIPVATVAKWLQALDTTAETASPAIPDDSSTSWCCRPCATAGRPLTPREAAAVTAAALPPGTHLTADVLNVIINNICGDQADNAASDDIDVTCVKTRGHDPIDPWHNDGRGCTWRTDEPPPATPPAPTNCSSRCTAESTLAGHTYDADCALAAADGWIVDLQRGDSIPYQRAGLKGPKKTTKR